MTRLHKISVLTSILAVTLAATAIAVAQTGGSATHKQPVAPTANPTITTPGAYAARQSNRFRGQVTAANQSHRWFRMRTTTNRSVRISTNRTTNWDDCDWGDMDRGHRVDVRAHRSHGRWVASRMQDWHHQGDDYGDDDGHMMR